MLYTFYCIIPAVLILVIIFVSAYYRMKAQESAVKKVLNTFKSIWQKNSWKTETGEAPFDAEFLRMYEQSYLQQGYIADENKTKYLLFKILILLIVASIPFLMLFLLTKKSVIFGDTQWNDIYLYIIIAVPLIFAFLMNKFIGVNNYRELWIQHSRIKSHMEWRMTVLIKDYEMRRLGMTPEEADKLLDEVKRSFIDDTCEYWKTSDEAFAEKLLDSDENMFQEIGKLFSSK